MTREQRAAQIWPILTLCATRRQSLTYDQLARLIGVLRPGLGQLLEPMQSYCILNSLPPLTVLVVSNIDGVPGPGFIAAEHVPSAQAQVYSFDWLSRQPAGCADACPGGERVAEQWRIAQGTGGQEGVHLRSIVVAKRLVLPPSTVTQAGRKLVPARGSR